MKNEIIFSSSEIAIALQQFASTYGENLEIGKVRTILADDSDRDFCKLEIVTQQNHYVWRKFAMNVIGASLVNYCAWSHRRLPPGRMHVAIAANSRVRLEFRNDD